MVEQPMDIYQVYKNLCDTKQNIGYKKCYGGFTFSLTIRPKTRSYSVDKSSSGPIFNSASASKATPSLY
jgi:hypothetical protein